MYLRGMLGLRLLETAATETAGAGGTTKPAETPPVADPAEGFKAALKARGDDATGLARDSWNRATEAERKLAEVTGKLPKAGAVILEGDDATEYAEFKKLGKASEVAGKLGTLGTLEQTIARHDREKLIGQAAKAHSFDADVLATLAGDLRIEIKDGKDKLGKDVKVAEVVATVKDERGEKEERTPLDKFAEKAWAKFLPSLRQADSKATSAPALRGNASVLPRTVTPEASRTSANARPVIHGRF